MAALGAHEAPSYRNLAFGLGKTGSAVTPGRFAERIYYQLEYKPSFKNPLYNELFTALEAKICFNRPKSPNVVAYFM
ncbi:hypothetical protein [Roseiarcus sp.]|jgi:hypothetical protein|uniref:hypothetical protein n=1 Tax=Roseiarcus sp. TaxID=1969460 RepID=UPI003F9BE016